MAITFIKAISTTHFLNTYNNNIVEFSSDNVLDSVKCSIAIGSFNFVITPINNLFRFNFKEVVKVLINTNNFEDLNIPDILEDVTQDDNLLSSFNVIYTVSFSDDSEETTNKDYTFLKSVDQISEYTEKPLTDHLVLNKKELTFFKGYPFDIGYYNTADFTIVNNTNNTSKSFTSAHNKGLRLWFSSGEYELSESAEEKAFVVRITSLTGGVYYEDENCYKWKQEYLFNEGLNNLTITNGSNEDISLVVKQKRICSGVYLKWVNEEGAWSYWLFNSIYKDTVKAKTIDVFNNDFNNINETYSTVLTTGKKAVNTLKLLADNLSLTEVEQLKSIVTSPRVELYNGIQDEDLTVSSWQSVTVSDGGFTILNTKRNLNKLAINIIKNKYTQY